MKRIILSLLFASSLCAVSSAFADPVISYTVQDDVYNPSPASGSTAPGATGDADTLNFSLAVYFQDVTIDFVNSSNIVTDVLTGGDYFTFYGSASGNSAIGTTCDAGGGTQCVLATGSVQDITGLFEDICCGDGDITVTVGDALPADPVTPEPSSIVLLLTGMAGTAGVARHRLFGAARM